MVAVRALKSLVVALPDGGFSLSLAKHRNQTQDEFLCELHDDFVRKISQVSNSKFFSVRGPLHLYDERVPRIFTAVYRQPYENDEEWQFPVEGDSGRLLLEQPVAADVNIAGPASAKASSSSRASRKKASDEVCNYCCVREDSSRI